MLRRAASRSLRDDMEYPVCADTSDGVTRRRILSKSLTMCHK
jgi:hypothetical protein